MSTINHSDYFVTGPNHILCEVPGVASYPTTFQDSWDMDHVRLACSNRIYPTDVSHWPEIVKALSQPIRSCQELSEVILRWNKAKEVGWNFNALDAFLNHRSDAELIAQAERIIDVNTPASESLDPLIVEALARVVIPKHVVSASEDEDEQSQQPQTPVALHIPLTSQFLSPAERTRFFDVILPRMQALALRLPELIKKPIPFLKQQQDSAITLSQEQIACLTANAFFNTFPGRNVPYKTKSYRRNVVVDTVNGLETAPQGALQLDFANKNIGGGALDRGAVQEEIRFMICPEMIVSRLFSQPMQANEAILIKGIEQYSDYIGYSKSFEWFADHRDNTPRDKLGRRQREICAIDAKPFKSKVSRIGQFDKPLVLREINKAIVGFRPSPINASEWGLVPQLEGNSESTGSSMVPRAIATGNWGCGAFGGHLQLKFILQWIAASVSSKLSPGMDSVMTHDMLYHTFGMPELGRDIEAFVKVLESKPSIEPKRLIECLVKYPRRSSTGEAEKLREKGLLEYLSSAVDY
ncbi:hypothetical protein BGZ52_008950 [Haplosporangium bisporale]|nr:hypothetical protein BGZ52_008950 [Haplosporangium bisporale]